MGRKDGRAARAQAMLRAVAEAGYSDTCARRAVVRALCDAPSGATPADLLSRGRSLHSRLGQVTVYRTLDILSGLGLVQRLHGEDGCSAYAAATREHGHYVICERCHRAAEFEGCAVDAALGGVTAQTGYRVSGHWLELFGLCPDCQKKGRRKA
jgi:Fur family ferric uptake transcriptional regulator